MVFLSWGGGFSLPVALVFGALISTTDPISGVALFRSLGAPKRLQTLMEGESLLNDGTAIMAFGLMLAIVESGRFSLGVSLVQFVRVAVGGLAVGILFGALISQIIKRIDDHLIATTLTFVLAYSAYAFAEDWGTSRVLAVVAAGMLCGNLTARSMIPTARLAVESFWEFAAFAVNSIVFLLIGREMNLAVLAAYTVGDCCRAVGARCYGLRPVLDRARHSPFLDTYYVVGWAARRYLPGAGTQPARILWLRPGFPADDGFRGRAF